MISVGGLQVFMRYVLNHSLAWSEEFQRFAHIWLIFLAVPVAYRQGSHIGMKVLTQKLPEKAQAALEALIDCLWLCLALCMLALIALYRAPGIDLTFLQIVKNQSSAGLGLRMDIVYLCIVFSSLYMGVTALQKLGDHVRRFRNRHGK
jgi:TRAP-type C4-dicarboxylate transport system permease small subunit